MHKPVQFCFWSLFYLFCIVIEVMNIDKRELAFINRVHCITLRLVLFCNKYVELFCDFREHITSESER